MKSIIITRLMIFFILSSVPIILSGASLKVHAVNIGCLFLSYFIPSVVAERYFYIKPKMLAWIVGGLIGLVIFDTLSSMVIVKREFLMGWYIIYPVGIFWLVVLQLLTGRLSKLLSYNKKNKAG